MRGKILWNICGEKWHKKLLLEKEVKEFCLSLTGNSKTITWKGQNWPLKILMRPSYGKNSWAERTSDLSDYLINNHNHNQAFKSQHGLIPSAKEKHYMIKISLFGRIDPLSK